MHAYWWKLTLQILPPLNYHWNNISRERIFELVHFAPENPVLIVSVNLSRIWSGALIGQRDIN